MGMWPRSSERERCGIFVILAIGLVSTAVAALQACAPAAKDAAVEPATPAELVLRGGAVYTLDPERPWAEAIAVSGGRITWVGGDEEAARWIGSATRVIDLDGKMVLPGFQDAHVHPVSGGVELGECDLNGLASVDAVLAAVRRCAEGLEPGEWLRGGGWDVPLFPDGNPRREALDEVVPGVPVFLSDADGHSVWVSSRALELAGVDADTSDPPNGRIERDPRTGFPSGTLRESATRLVGRLLPRHTDEDRREGLRRAVAMAGAFGITSWLEANASTAELDAYRALDDAGELTVRTAVAVGVDLDAGPEQVARLTELRERYTGGRVRVGTAKIFADGVIEGAQTAALLEPYSGTDSRGIANLTQPQLDALAIALDAAGFQIHVHAIGDRAIRMSLDAFEAARRASGVRDSRHTLVHIQLFDPTDIPRFAELGVVADFQPLWAYADTYIVELTEPVLGPERSRRLYPIRSLVDAGASIACGSDWSVTSMNPLLGIEVGVTRRDPKGEGSAAPAGEATAAGARPEAAGAETAEGGAAGIGTAVPGATAQRDDPGAWIPEERVDLATMLACYTSGAAWALFQENATGSLVAGKAADLIVLDRNLFAIPPAQISESRVLLTLVGGREVYRDVAWPAR